MNLRQATHHDLAQLAELRWVSRTEEDGEIPRMSHEAFTSAFIRFFTEGFESGDDWSGWPSTETRFYLTSACRRFPWCHALIERMTGSAISRIPIRAQKLETEALAAVY